MCLLIVIRGLLPSHPVVVASNRDERTDRPSAPPGLWVGRERRVLCPRDREQNGTWMGVNDRGLFAGLTNVAGAPVPEGAITRGRLPLLALDTESLDEGVAAVAAQVRNAPFAGFQLVLCDGLRTVVLRHVDGALSHVDWTSRIAIVTNEHAIGELELPLLTRALDGSVGEVDALLERLRPVLLDDGSTGLGGGYGVLKRGEGYGTVSSSILGVPESDVRELRWLFAAGPPDAKPHRSYSNLARRLADESAILEPDRVGW